MNIPPHMLHLCIIKTTKIKGLKYNLKVFLTFKLVYKAWKDNKKDTEKGVLKCVTTVLWMTNERQEQWIEVAKSM